jgi:hypothetical protein
MGGDLDRISALPDDQLHVILARVEPTPVVTRTAVMSHLERLNGGLAEQIGGGSWWRERLGLTEPDDEWEESIDCVGDEGAKELGTYEELVGDAEGIGWRHQRHRTRP